MFDVHNYEPDVYSGLMQRYVKLILRRCLPNVEAMTTMIKIATSTNKYDLGIHLLPPIDFRPRMAVPNKLFEFVQVRLAVPILPSLEMAHVVNKYEFGVVANDFAFETMAEKLNSLTWEQIERFKENAHKTTSLLCANNQKLFLSLVRQLLEGRV